MAASEREIEDVRKNPGLWRLLIQHLLDLHRTDLTDEFLDFADRVLPLAWLTEISYRQAEWLLAVRDNFRFVSTYRHFSIKALLKACYENRLDFDEATEEWITTTFKADVPSLRLYEAKRIYGLAYRIGEVDRADEAA